MSKMHMSSPAMQGRRTTRMRLTMTLLPALLLAVAALLTLTHAAYAADDQPLDAAAAIVVNTINPGISDNGQCSLIEALENANADAQIHDDCAAGSGADIVSLPVDAVMIFTATHNTVGGNNALPVITGTVTIVGNGTTLVRSVNGTPSFRFFNVAAGANLTLIELEMRNGRVGLTGTTQLLQGGGAIVNQGTLHIIDGNLSFNRATFGGAIYSQPDNGSLTIENTTFSSNVADMSGGAIHNNGPGAITGGMLRLNQAGNNGGAIMHDSSTLTVSSATVRDNTSGGAGGGIFARALISDTFVAISGTRVISNVAALNGGGIYNTASNGLTSMIEIENSRITANRATATSAGNGVGGGIFNGWTEDFSGGVASVTLRQSAVMDNVAQLGGGIASLDTSSFPTRTVQVDIRQSTLARNTATGTGSGNGTGGGLYNSNGTASVANSTVSANQAVGDDTVMGGRGGGIANIGRGTATTLDLINSTIAFNEASQAGGGIAVVGEVTTSATSMNVGNTLVVSNVLSVTESVTNVVALANITAPQAIPGTESCSLEDGTATSLGGNIEDGDTCGFTAASDLENTPVVLEALADNGGATQTHMIIKGGPAYNRGVAALCNNPPVSGVDQRGVTRPQGDACDIGAVERELPPPVPGALKFPQIYKFHIFS